MDKVAKFTARISREGDWFVAFSPEFPEGNGQGLSEEEALESLRFSIELLSKDREIDGEGRPPGDGASAWDHLSAFAGSVDDSFVIPPRTDLCRPAPRFE